MMRRKNLEWIQNEFQKLDNKSTYTTRHRVVCQIEIIHGLLKSFTYILGLSSLNVASFLARSLTYFCSLLIG